MRPSRFAAETRRLRRVGPRRRLCWSLYTPVGGILAIYDFVAANDNFEIDKLLERLLYTVNVDGFLKRVK